MKTTVPSISEAEWEVMNVLWAAGPAALRANDIVERVARKDWSPRTVKTLLNRLVRKRALDFKVDGKSYLYRAAVSREQCVQAVSRSFVDRVFGGSPGPMLVHFVEHARLSQREIEQLRQILSNKNKDKEK